MSNTFLVLMVGAVVTAAILLVRHLRRRDSVGYQRRFVNGAPARRQDEAFPFASTLYLGDGGSSSHAHHPHSADCAHASDAGGGCSDGGGGSSH
jgi:uncharacterized membrane protein YgcG